MNILLKFCTLIIALLGFCNLCAMEEANHERRKDFRATTDFKISNGTLSKKQKRIELQLPTLINFKNQVLHPKFVIKIMPSEGRPLLADSALFVCSYILKNPDFFPKEFQDYAHDCMLRLVTEGANFSQLVFDLVDKVPSNYTFIKDLVMKQKQSAQTAMDQYNNGKKETNKKAEFRENLAQMFFQAGAPKYKHPVVVYNIYGSEHSVIADNLLATEAPEKGFTRLLRFYQDAASYVYPIQPVREKMTDFSDAFYENPEYYSYSRVLQQGHTEKWHQPHDDIEALIEEGINTKEESEPLKLLKKVKGNEDITETMPNEGKNQAPLCCDDRLIPEETPNGQDIDPEISNIIASQNMRGLVSMRDLIERRIKEVLSSLNSGQDPEFNGS